MDCEKFDTVTMDLLYGELDELSEAAALRHLHHCMRCRDIWGHLRTTRELAEIPLEEPPADLFENVIAAERKATKTLPVRERASRAISVLAEYAMRPQLAMAALLLLMIGSSLIFVRTGPADRGQVSVTELGTPTGEGIVHSETGKGPLVFEGDDTPAPRSSDEDNEAQLAVKADVALEKDSKGSSANTANTYREAMAAYQEGRYAEAERLFSEVASAGDEQAASAALHEGHAARNGSGCQRAAALYDSVATRFDGGTVGDEAAWHAATCYRAMGQPRRAASHYSRLKLRPAYASRAERALFELDELAMVAAAQAEKSAGDPATTETSSSSAKPAAEPNSSSNSNSNATPRPSDSKAAPAPNPKSD